MNERQFADFRANPATYLGTRGLRIAPPAVNMTGANQLTLNLPELQAYDPRQPGKGAPGAYPCSVLDAAMNAHELYFAENAAQDQVEIRALDQGTAARRGRTYYLPWEENKVYALRLPTDGEVNLFATAELNGCCLYIAGDPTSPTVVHANLSTDDLEKVELNGVPFAQMGEHLRKEQRKIYDRNYWALLGRMIGRNVLPNDSAVKLFDPGTYFAPGGSKARVVGVREGGRWRFFSNVETDRKVGRNTVHVSGGLWP